MLVILRLTYIYIFNNIYFPDKSLTDKIPLSLFRKPRYFSIMSRKEILDLRPLSYIPNTPIWTGYINILNCPPLHPHIQVSMKLDLKGLNYLSSITRHNNSDDFPELLLEEGRRSPFERRLEGLKGERFGGWDYERFMNYLMV